MSEIRRFIADSTGLQLSNLLYFIGIMTYRQAMKVSWALAREIFWWSVVAGLPLLMAFLALRQLEVGAVNSKSSLVSLWLLLVLFVILPQSITEAVSRSYENFRLSVLAENGRRHISYVQALQISALAMAMYLVLGAFFLVLHLGSAFAFLQFPFLLLLIFPATALFSVRMPFHGFRLFFIRN